MDVNNLPKWIFLAGWGWGGGVESVASYSTHLNRFKQVGGEYKLQKYLLGKQQKWNQNLIKIQNYSLQGRAVGLPSLLSLESSLQCYFLCFSMCMWLLNLHKAV